MYFMLYSDTLQPIDLAPPTKKLMRLREIGTSEKLFSNPGNPNLRAACIVKVVF